MNQELLFIINRESALCLLGCLFSALARVIVFLFFDNIFFYFTKTDIESQENLGKEDEDDKEQDNNYV